MSDHLMLSRRFAPLFLTQALAAFNDNFLKNTLVLLIVFRAATAEGAGNPAALVTLAGGLFTLPFLLLSAIGGEIADKHDKAKITRLLKLAEIAAAAVSVLGLWLESVPVLMAALVMFGVGSALFGPIKYGILPDLIERQELPKANAWIEGATFVAILAGTIAAGFSFAAGGADLAVFGPAMIALAVFCYVASRFIPSTKAADPSLVIDRNVFRSTFRLVSELRADRRLFVAASIVSWFWLVGAIVLSILPPLVESGLHAGPEAITSYLAVFAVSVAVGSGLAAWMSAGRIVLLPAPVGTLLAGAFALDLAWTASGMGPAAGTSLLATPGAIRLAVDLAGVAVAGSFLVVPSFAALQTWASEEKRARVVAANNILNSLYMTVGAAAVAAAQAMGASLSSVAFALGVANVAAAAVMFRFLPTSAFRDFISILFRAFHRLEVEGLENIAKAGPTPILALNHVSFLDGPLALALTDRAPVFAINTDIAKRWWVKPFLKVCRAMPLDPAKPMATRTLIRTIEGGDMVAIFPEGRITVTGSLMKVYDGAAMVADKTGAMVVPIRIDGLERSIFSRLTSGQVKRSLFPKVKVTVLEPVALSVDPALKGRKRRAAAGAELYRVMSGLVFRTSIPGGTVFEAVVRAGKRHGMDKLAVQDPVTGDLDYGKLLIGANVLGRKLASLCKDETNVGVMLPNANGAAVTVLALMSAGKVPAMVNFTAGASSILSACEAASLRKVLTSRAFVKQAKLDTVVAEIGRKVEIVYLDDVRASVKTADKLRGLLAKSRPLVKRKATDPAVILFTSGSEGTPKGVVLTHANILANAAQAAARIDFHTGDKVFNVLPVFHSFGLTAGLVLPLVSGVPVYLYPSPLHYRLIPELIYGSNSTIIFGTDTFLSGYARSAHPYDFRSIRYCFAGAEPVKAATRTTYMEKFGIRILEGYGVTEAAPVIAINTPMYNRAGSVGKLMPGMEARLEPVPGVDEGGRLFVKGPNVMAGYLRAERPGVLEPLSDGWHDTGDIVTIDEEGFITIKGRAKRFAKIGGEMISLAAVEAAAGEVWPGVLSAVASVPDPRKGERLTLVTEAEGATRDQFLKHAKARGLSELMVPAEVVVAKVPVLGSGKVDFPSVTKFALSLKDAKAA